MTETPTNPRQTLEFESDRGSNKSRWVAGGLAIAIIGWMGSGYILPSEDTEETAKTSVTPRAVTVAVRRSDAEVVEQVFVAEGQALPDRDTMIRAETSGQIGEVLVEMGADLEAGQVIARFGLASRQADLERAEQELGRAQREFDNATELVKRGIATVDRVAQARATLAAAQASVSEAQEAIKNTEIRAPFAGRLESLDINIGEFVSMGADVGRIVDNTPLTISIQIPQQSLRDIKVGQAAQVAFITDETSTGEVQFVATSADAETRTFMAKITVPNTDGAIPAGISAQLRIPTGELTAHFVSPAILSLDTDGTLGIKTVNPENVVEFHKIDIVRAQTDGIWVSGLPEQTQIITIGQGFVNSGETVNPQAEQGVTKVSAQTDRSRENADTEAGQ
ncbi:MULTISPECIES: efflux RND transporter periplasmic adaptor subunit [Roseobacteraceae]|uniref:Cobalt-zinc-cadmium resistance protein CzcB n=1 Tax=Pseudosulfitobacter pseudonitzschiae TaxID=1402135 RepID=A0A221K781_9RHOB|nr:MULTISPECIES: efflux RND transporter periplasmic adaptor subunit [Roseobacteraceae]ASM74839.1 cobalt-zinc-cadmium resistance protein CzcB [Pseudosulfitobacter pseudonitzschiae]